MEPKTQGRMIRTSFFLQNAPMLYFESDMMPK